MLQANPRSPVSPVVGKTAKLISSLKRLENDDFCLRFCKLDLSIGFTVIIPNILIAFQSSSSLQSSSNFAAVNELEEDFLGTPMTLMDGDGTKRR